MKRVTVIDGIVDAVYLCEPPKGVEAIEATDEVFQGWRHDGASFHAPTRPVEDLRSEKTADIVAKANELLTAGAPVTGGLHVALDDGSRADLTAMAQMATNAMGGALAWSDSYARGWITVENIRIPLATPAEGLALAASVGNFYAAVMQHRRDLKDAALAAKDAAALDAIDAADGWPA
jgi:hypothetical protein